MPFTRRNGSSRFHDLSMAEQPFPSAELDQEFNQIYDDINGLGTLNVNISEWALLQNAVVYVGGTQFYVVGDLTAIFPAGRAIRADLNGSYSYGYVQSSSYDAITGRTTITLKTNVLSNALAGISYGLLTPGSGVRSYPDDLHAATAAEASHATTADSATTTTRSDTCGMADDSALLDGHDSATVPAASKVPVSDTNGRLDAWVTAVAAQQSVFSCAMNADGLPDFLDIALFGLDVTANMTANNLPDPLVADRISAYSASYEAWKAFDGNKAVGGTAWMTPNGVSTGWLSIDFGNAKIIKRYAVTHTNATTTYAPKAWDLQGSNDGLAWNTLDSRSGETAWSNGETREYTFSNATGYRYYRLNVSENNGGNNLMVGELELMEQSNAVALDKINVLATDFPLVVNFADGLYSRLAEISADLANAFTGLAPYSDNYLYVNRGDDGTITYGSTTAPPAFSFDGSPRPYTPDGLMPDMADYTNAPGYLISASTENSTWYAWKAFSRSSSAYWQSSAKAAWLKVKLPSTRVINRYSIVAALYNQNVNTAPSDWTFEGSNDGANWTTLDTQNNEGSWNYGERRWYSCNNNTAYLYYRLNITDNNGNATYTTVVDFQIYERATSCFVFPSRKMYSWNSGSAQWEQVKRVFFGYASTDKNGLVKSLEYYQLKERLEDFKTHIVVTPIGDAQLTAGQQKQLYLGRISGDRFGEVTFGPFFKFRPRSRGAYSIVVKTSSANWTVATTPSAARPASWNGSNLGTLVPSPYSGGPFAWQGKNDGGGGTITTATLPTMFMLETDILEFYVTNTSAGSLTLKDSDLSIEITKI